MDQPTAGTGRISLTKSQRESEVGAELLSLCQTSTADGSLSVEEVAALREWLQSKSGTELPAIAFLNPIVEQIIADGIVTPEERRDLFLAIEKVLPVDIRHMSRSARLGIEEAEKSQRKAAAAEAKKRNTPLEWFDFMVAGAKYNSRPTAIAHLADDEPVELQRDIGNKFSRNAIRVLSSRGREIGFIPEEDAKGLAPMLDQGLRYSASVKKILSGSTHRIPVIDGGIYRDDATVDGLRSTSLSSPQAARTDDASRNTALFVAIVIVAAVVLKYCGG